jgi:hypothetical protein
MRAFFAANNSALSSEAEQAFLLIITLKTGTKQGLRLEQQKA